MFSKRNITIFTVLVLAIVSFKGFDHYKKVNAGYCFVENKMLTDNEVVDVAVTRLLENLDKEYRSLAPDEQVKRIRYNTLEEFYERQPKCCGVSGDNGKSKYPPKPNGVWYKETFSRRILYQYRKDGKKKYRGLTIIVPFCGAGAFVHIPNSFRSEYKWGVGSPTHVSPHSKYHEKSNIRGNE